MALFRARRRAYQPSPRWGHFAVSLGSRVNLWGGRTVNFLKIQGKPQNPSVVEVLDGLLQEWQQKTTSGAGLLPLYGGACATLGSSAYSCCGYDGTIWHNSIYKIESDSNEWNMLQPSNPADGPMPKAACGMIAIDDDKLAIIGGYGKPSHPLQPGATFIRDTRYTDGQGWTNEFHLFHTKYWNRPPPCSNFTFTAVDHNTAILFAGRQAEVGRVNNIFILNHRLMHWTKLNTHGPRPKARVGHAACCINYGTDSPVLLVSGGIDIDGNTLSDAWLLYITNATWKEVELPGLVPRCYHTITAISLAPGFTEVAMFGGCPKFDPTVSDDKLAKLADTVLVQLEFIDVATGDAPPTKEWVVTGVATIDQLGTAERLREKLQKLREHGAFSGAQGPVIGATSKFIDVVATGDAPPTKEWVVTGVATMDQLGTPERLREKLQKLREHGAFSGAQGPVIGATSSETCPLHQRIAVLEDRVREAERGREEERRGREEERIGREEAERVREEERRGREEERREREEAERRREEERLGKDAAG